MFQRVDLVQNESEIAKVIIGQYQDRTNLVDKAIKDFCNIDVADLFPKFEEEANAQALEEYQIVDEYIKNGKIPRACEELAEKISQEEKIEITPEEMFLQIYCENWVRERREPNEEERKQFTRDTLLSGFLFDNDFCPKFVPNFRKMEKWAQELLKLRLSTWMGIEIFACYSLIIDFFTYSVPSEHMPVPVPMSENHPNGGWFWPGEKKKRTKGAE